MLITRKCIIVLGAIQIIRDTFLALFCPPPPPPVWHSSFFDDWFLGLYCFEILNLLKRKFILKLYLALWRQVFLPKALKIVLLKMKKVCVTLRWTPSPPLRVSRIFWMIPYFTSEVEYWVIKKLFWIFLYLQETNRGSKNRQMSRGIFFKNFEPWFFGCFKVFRAIFSQKKTISHHTGGGGVAGVGFSGQLDQSPRGGGGAKQRKQW